MTTYTAKCEDDEADWITAERSSDRRVLLSGYHLGSWKTNAYISPGPARTFARGILALADEIYGGEAPTATEDTPKSVKVGDRIRITEDGLHDAGVRVGDVFTVAAVDEWGTFDTDGPGWIFEFGHIGNGLEILPADEPTPSDPRAALLARAAELADGWGVDVSASDVVRVAEFLAAGE